MTLVKARRVSRVKEWMVRVVCWSQWMTASMLEELGVGVVGVEVSVARQVMLPGGR